MKLNDTELLAILSEGDLVAIEAKYHLRCLARLYNKVSRSECKTSGDQERLLCEGIAFADVLVFIQTKLNESSHITFRMGELSKSYQERLAQLTGCTSDSLSVHTTRLREKILAHFPSLMAHKSGREYVLVKEGANLISLLHKEDQDDDALTAHFFLKQIRKIMKDNKVKFVGEFKEGCEESSVPSSLLAVVNTLLYGSPVPPQCGATTPALTIAQLLMFNFRETVPKGSIVRSKREYETPLPLYMGLAAYGKGRDKALIEELHTLGLSVSYNRVNEITSQLCRKVINEANSRQVLCPSNLRHGVMVAAAIDNIDHNPSSNTSVGSGFHGTGISLFQMCSEEHKGTPQASTVKFQEVESHGTRNVPPLPDFYCYVPECALPAAKPNGPGISMETGEQMVLSGRCYVMLLH